MNIEVHQERLDKDGKPVEIPKAKEGHIAGGFDLA
jgi:hypothetical protein